MDPLEYETQKLEELYGMIRERQANIYNRKEVRHMTFYVSAYRSKHVMLYVKLCYKILLKFSILSYLFTCLESSDCFLWYYSIENDSS